METTVCYSKQNDTYREFGKGNHKLVLLPHFGGDMESWKWVAKHLSKDIRALSLTLPGFGNRQPLRKPSLFGYAKFINTQLDALGYEDYVLCGHSFGAIAASYAAQINQNNPPRKLILVSPQPLNHHSTGLGHGKPIVKGRKYGHIEEMINRSTNRKLNNKKMNYLLRTETLIDKTTNKWWQSEGYRNVIGERIQGLTMPTHVIHSKEDPVVTFDQLHQNVLPSLPRPNLVTFGRCGHLIPFEAPRKLATRINRIVLR